MTTELLELIQWWQQVYPEAWPEGLVFDASNPTGYVAWQIKLKRRHSLITEVAALAIIESAVMDWLTRMVGCPLWIDVFGANGPDETCFIRLVGVKDDEDAKGRAPIRLHALLLAVKEMINDA